MRVLKPVMLLIVCSSVLAGCSTAPIYRVPQPWVRSLSSHQRINATGQIAVEVSGSTAPLLGNEQLVAGEIQETLAQLLTRRGYSIVTTSPDYTVRLSYKTERNTKTQTSVVFIPIELTSSSTCLASASLGVGVARYVGALAYRSGTVGMVESGAIYTHVISIEMQNRNGQLIWKGESTWDSDMLNLINGIVPAIQILVSDFPSEHAIRPEIPEVKASHVENYFLLVCKNRWFTCPALPYRIAFSPAVDPLGYYSPVKDPSALAAFVDLLQTAENALPDGRESDWVNPLEPSLWGKATLGGQYLLGPSKKPINLIVKLSGTELSYTIDECKTVSDEEYGKFNDELAKWKKVLQNYYDVYVK